MHALGIFIIGCFWSSINADELFVVLTQESGAYKLYYTTNETSPWQSFNVPSQIKMIQDVEFDYGKKMFYFASNQTLEKGLWKANMTLGNAYLSQKLRDDSSPTKLVIYPEYDLALFYDEAYSLVIEITLLTENGDLRLKSLFQTADRLNGMFVLDRKTNQIYAQPDDSRGSLFASSLNGSLLTSTPFIDGLLTNAGITAFDSDIGLIYYCSDGVLKAMRVNDSITYWSATKFTCSPMAADNGVVYYANLQTNTIEKLRFGQTVITSINSNFLKLPISVSMTTTVMAIKHYSYSNNISHYCQSLGCDQICLPANSGGTASCTCMDYYVIPKNASANRLKSSPCQLDTLATPGVFYGVYNTSFSKGSTLFYRLNGDPAIWTRRPQREQLVTINSDIAAVAYDWAGQRLFAVALRYREIMSTSLNGGFDYLVHYSGISPNVKSIAYDWVGRNIIWFDPVFKWLRIVPIWQTPKYSRVQTNSYKTTLVSANLAGYALRLDAVAGYIFFLEIDDFTSLVSLWRSLLDGSELAKMYTFPSSVYSDSLDDSNPEVPLPGALNVDFFYQTVWVAFVNDIFVLRYDGKLLYSTKIGSSDETIYNSRVVSLALFNTTYALVVTKRIDTRVSRLTAYAIVRNSGGSCCSKLINSFTKIIAGGDYRVLTNFEAQPVPPSNLNCTALNCSSICTNIKGIPTCLCPDGYVKDNSTKACKPSAIGSLSTPALVFTARNKICYRSLIDKTSYGGTSSFATYDNCTYIGSPTASSRLSTVTGTSDSPYFTEVDPVSFNAFTFEFFSTPRSTYKVNLLSATANDYQVRDLQGFLNEMVMLLLNSSRKANSTNFNNYEVMYSAIASNVNYSAALGFDWLARNLYIADQANGRLLVTNYYLRDPLIVATDVNFRTITVDTLRRKMYWAIGYGGGTVIVQRDLDASRASECLVANLTEAVVEMHISDYNQTLLFLVQPSNKIGRVLLKTFPPYVSTCQSTLPVVQYNTLAIANVTHFAGYRSMILFTCKNCSQTVYSSFTLGSTVDGKVSVFAPGGNAQLTSLAVFDPQLVAVASNQTGFVAADRCASMARGQCEQFCLSSWPATSAQTLARCNCSDGMRLLNDGRTCAPRAIDISTNGIIFTADYFRHTLYAIPANAVANPTGSLKQLLTTFTLHAKAHPYGLVYDYVADYLYYADVDHGAIYRVSPMKQMSTNFTARNTSDEKLIDIPAGLGNWTRGLAVDPISGTLFFIPLYSNTLWAADVVAKQAVPVRNFSSFGNIIAITVDLRADRRHLYLSLHNGTFVNGPNGQQILTQATIIRCALDGSNCVVFLKRTSSIVVASTLTVFGMTLDFSTDRMYFITGDNYTIMYKSLNDLSNEPQTLYHSDDGYKIFKAIAVTGNFVVVTDILGGGFHIYDKNTGKYLGVLLQQYAIQIEGLALFTPAIQAYLPKNDGCSGESRICSHVCVSLINNERKCLCPNGAETVDGINCPGVPVCQKPPLSLGTFDSGCNFRGNTRTPCTMTCSSENTAIDPKVRGKSFLIACITDASNKTQWCTELGNLCRQSNAPAANQSIVNKCVQQAEILEALAIGTQTSTATQSETGSLQPGAIAGIVIACLFVFALIVIIGFFAVRRQHSGMLLILRFADIRRFFRSSTETEPDTSSNMRYRNLSENEASGNSN